MALYVNCGMCQCDLKEQGGLLWSPPDWNSRSEKTHLCIDCYEYIINVIEEDPRATDI